MAIILITWLALPPANTPTAPVVAVAQPSGPAATPAPARVAVATVVLPTPAAKTEPEREEQSEMTAPDPDPAQAEAPAPAPPLPPPAPRQTTVAALTPPPPARAQLRRPAWLRFAVPTPAIRGRPQIAIVIDDLGLDRRRTERTISLRGPLTLSFLGYASDLPRLAESAHRAGHELLVHVPMEPISRAEDMGPNGLSVGLGRDEVLRRLRWNLDRFDGYVGINNHMGSRFTADSGSMMPVMQELRTRGLLFLDSRTIGNSAGIELAQRFDVPHAARDVFLDNEVNGAAIAAQLAEVETIARRHGSAIAIGHPHDATLEELSSWLAALESKGFVLVPVSTIVRERWHADAASG